MHEVLSQDKIIFFGTLKNWKNFVGRQVLPIRFVKWEGGGLSASWRFSGRGDARRDAGKWISGRCY